METLLKQTKNSRSDILVQVLDCLSPQHPHAHGGGKGDKKRESIRIKLRSNKVISGQFPLNLQKLTDEFIREAQGEKWRSSPHVILMIKQSDRNIFDFIKNGID